MTTRITLVLTNAFELTVFFAAAAALGVGLLGLR